MSQRETVRLDDDEEVPVAEPGLSEKEQAKVEESQRPRAPVLYEIIRLEGENELGRPAMSLWWSGFAAGISIGFSFLTEAALAALLPKAEWAHIVSALGYTTGFIMVILGRQQLFTENVLTAVLPVVARSKLSWFLGMLRLWGIVLAANIVGCLVFACAFAFLPIVNTAISSEMAGLVHTLMGNTVLEMFAKGIAAGWLIAAVVWMLPSAGGMEIFVIGLLTYLISLFRLTHIVAGSAEALYGWVLGLTGTQDVILKFFLPTLAGNVVGGTVLFSVLSYAQVRHEIFEEETREKYGP